MNYTQNVKEEIEPKIAREGKECLAFLSAVTKCLGSMSIFKDGMRLEYDFKDNESVFTVMQILKDYFDCEVECKIHNGQSMNFTLYVNDEYSNKMLTEMKLPHQEGERVVLPTVSELMGSYTTQEEMAAFIQGVFVCNGGVYIPDDVDSKGGYHVEINILQEDFANELVAMLNKCGLEFSIADRQTTLAVYAKKKQTVCDFLALINAYDAALYLNEIMIRREINNDINRIANINAANTDRKYISNSKYISAIEVVKEVVGLESLEDKLEKIAKARLQNHDESMGSLAERLGMSKSSVSRGLNKIVDMAKRIKGEE